MTKRKWLRLLLATGLCLVGGTLSGYAAPPGPGKFYVVGTGPAGPEYATLKAIDTIKKADLVLSDPKMAERFQAHLKGKKVEDPWKELWHHQGKMWLELLPRLQPEERRSLVEQKVQQRDKFVQRIKGLLARGKRVVLLDGGDPTVFSRSYWLLEGLDDEQVEIIPGVGALAASMAALKRPSTGGGARFLAQTAGFSFFGKPDRDDLARNLAGLPGTLVVYMGLRDAEKIVAALKKFNPGDLPVAVVYFAGYRDKEKIVKGNLANILEKIAPEKEKFMGLIIVGRCLEGPRFPSPEVSQPAEPPPAEPVKDRK
ncbi:MAG: SAM-dependent methyltransferase [Thermodesulfobacteriota bacterium]